MHVMHYRPFDRSMGLWIINKFLSGCIVHQNHFKVPMKWNFSPLFYSRKLKSVLHWFIILEFKLWSCAQNNFLSPQSRQKMQLLFPKPGTSDVIRRVSLDCFTLSQYISYKVSTHWAVFLAVLFCGKCLQVMNYPVTHHLRVMLSHCS